MKLFTNSLEGIFLSRPNRFIVHVETSEGEIRAHCPNPGRLLEILTPRRKVILEKSTDPSRRTPYTLVAAHYRGKVVPLYSARANKIAGEMIVPELFPQADTIRAEAVKGKSRFDYLVSRGDNKIFIEVKACTLVEQKVAMFPDAPTTRGRRHVMELAELSLEGRNIRGMVLLVINHRDGELFIPNFHTDPDFSQTLEECSNKVEIRCVSIDVSPSGGVKIINFNVPLSFKGVESSRKDEGVYLLLVELPEDKEIEIGALGKRKMKKGFYIYTGSARTNLSKRVKRHVQKKKKIHWHIDYLTTAGGKSRAFPIHTPLDIECELASKVKVLGDEEIKSFGSSDCGCVSHLFYFKNNPLGDQRFLDMLFYYRHVRALEF